MAHNMNTSQNSKPNPNANQTNNNDNVDQKDIDQRFVEYNERIEKFEENLEKKLPIDTNNINNFNKNVIYDHMNRSYPLLHGSLLSLIHHFLLIKTKYGTSIEKDLYANMTIKQFMNRLATKRAVVFYQGFDSYLLRNGFSDATGWQYIGTDKENDINDVNNDKKPKLKDYLSYDELMINAMCGVSSPTYFINNGDRGNNGQLMNDNHPDKDKYPLYGIYTGLVGARFERPEVMEYALMLIDNDQNKAINGYGSDLLNNRDDYIKTFNENNFNIDAELDDDIFMKMVQLSCDIDNNRVIWRAFERFYSRNYLPKYDVIKDRYYDATNNVNFQNPKMRKQIMYRYHPNGNEDAYLDCEMFKQRIRITLELFLFDADKRCKERFNKLNNISKNTMYGAYCHVVGLGTGVWSFIKSEQDRIIVEVSKDIIESSNLKYISCIYFSWMDDDCMSKTRNDNTIMFPKDNKMNDYYYVKDDRNNKIYVGCGKRNPADILEPPFQNCLPVAMYAWDSNAFPGNEYYIGMLSASGDPAAASCSTISFTQNSEINKENINGDNTGVFFFDEIKKQYEFYKLKDIDLDNNASKAKWLKKSVLSIPYKRSKIIKNSTNKKLVSFNKPTLELHLKSVFENVYKTNDLADKLAKGLIEYYTENGMDWDDIVEDFNDDDITDNTGIDCILEILETNGYKIINNSEKKYLWAVLKQCKPAKVTFFTQRNLVKTQFMDDKIQLLVYGYCHALKLKPSVIDLCLMYYQKF